MDNPYSAPQPENKRAPITEEPKAIKIFGILHLVFGSLGLLSVLLGLVFILGMDPLFNWLAEQTSVPDAPDGSADPSEIIRLMGDFYVSQLLLYLVSTVITAILVVILLMAGFALVKKRKKAARQSNLWAWLAIIFVIAGLPVNFFYVLPAQQEMQRELNELAGNSASGNATAEQVGQWIGVIFGALFTLVYPILALVFLKRKEVNAYLAQHGT